MLFIIHLPSCKNLKTILLCNIHLSINNEGLRTHQLFSSLKVLSLQILSVNNSMFSIAALFCETSNSFHFCSDFSHKVFSSFFDLNYLLY